MSRLLDDLDQRIGRPTVERALRRLGTTPDEFDGMSGAEFQGRLDAYIGEMQAWVTRNQARTDQMQAARRMGDEVPSDMHDVPLYELAQRGVIDMDEFRSGMATLVRIQQEEESDPFPEDEDVTQLLNALRDIFEVDG